MTERFAPSRHVRWIVRAYGVDIFRDDANTVRLTFPESKLWESMLQDGRPPVLVEELQMILDQERAATEDWVDASLSAWRQGGLIEPQAERRHN